MKVIKFSAVWCSPCKVYSPVFEAVSKEVEDHTFESVDIEDSPELATKYKITSVPTTIHLDDNGEEIGRVSGALPKNALIAFLEGE
jgi:thioredoxin 1